MKGPIKPSEVQGQKDATLPSEVYDVFNALIVKAWDGREAVVLQKDAVARLKDVMKVSRQHVFDSDWLDVEEAYRKAGWKVKYDKPVAWGGDTYEAYYSFKK